MATHSFIFNGPVGEVVSLKGYGEIEGGETYPIADPLSTHLVAAIAAGDTRFTQGVDGVGGDPPVHTCVSD